MSRPWPHPKTGVYLFRKRVPKDLLAAVGKREEKASLGTKDVAKAKRLHAEHILEVEKRWANLRKGSQNLSMMEINAISGDFYRTHITEYQSGRISPFGLMNAADRIADYLQKPTPQSHEEFCRYHGREIDVYLSVRGLMLSTETRGSLDYAVAKSIIQAIEQANNYLAGDYRPDPLAERFAKLPTKAPEVSLPLDEWFSKYATASDLAASTRKRWRPALDTLVTFVGHDDLARITPDNVADWVDKLAEDGRGDKTIRDVYLASAKALFGWVKDKRKIATNPCAGIRVKVVEGPVLRDRYFTEAEASTILAAAMAPRNQRLSPEHAAARRWVPWLCAYSGARVGEIAQLRRQDFRDEGGVPVFRITPDAGTVKTKKFSPSYSSGQWSAGGERSVKH